MSENMMEHATGRLDDATRQGREDPTRQSREDATPQGREDAARERLEAAAFRRLVDHLRAHPEVQNIDLMNLAGFCRNCLSRWYREAAEAEGMALADAAAREIVYGMPYREWQARYQTGEKKPAAPVAD